jgi:mRNA interferase MazF
MRSMSELAMKRGDVVLVDFPYSDQTGSKLRPALVVQADALNQKLDDTILALITSSRRRMVGSPTQLVIKVATNEGRSSGLRMDSVVQCENLVTREQRLLKKKLGDLPANLMAAIDDCLRAALSL